LEGVSRPGRHLHPDAAGKQGRHHRRAHGSDEDQAIVGKIGHLTTRSTWGTRQGPRCRARNISRRGQWLFSDGHAVSCCAEGRLLTSARAGHPRFVMSKLDSPTDDRADRAFTKPDQYEPVVLRAEEGISTGRLPGCTRRVGAKMTQCARDQAAIIGVEPEGRTSGPIPVLGRRASSGGGANHRRWGRPVGVKEGRAVVGSRPSRW